MIPSNTMTLKIRPVLPTDKEALWAIIEPVIRAGNTYMYAPGSSREKMLGIWFDSEKYAYAAEEDRKSVV